MSVIDAQDILASDHVPEERRIPIGISTIGWPEVSATQSSQRRLLFLAGMTRSKQFDEVMDKRGLALLLQAGEPLAGRGFTLQVAVPLLEDPSMRLRVLNSSLNTWPLETLRLEGAVDIPGVFLRSDILVFAYTEDIKAFRPTSVMEAMMAGRPVVLPDHAWLHRQVQKDAAYWFDPAHLSDLCMAIEQTQDDYRALAERVLSHAQSTFNVGTTIDAIFSHLGR